MAKERESFSPFALYAAESGAAPPRVFGAPQRYIQGPGVLARTGRYVSSLGVRHAAVLLSARSQGAEGGDLLAGLSAAGIDATVATFAGQCSLEEIERHADALRGGARDVDFLIAVGGGKCVDTGKSLAYRLGVPLVVVPTLASNDAPCSAVSVVYTPEGVSDDVELFPQSPAMVVVDTAVIAAAAERYLVAGMGDAMATWYEARVAAANPRGIAPIGGRPTMTGVALGKLCADTLYRQGVAAAEAVRRSTVDEALEEIVEANTLLSGLGFESGGLAVAHSLAQGYTAVKSVKESNLHGEMVAMGLLAQLVLEDSPPDALQAAHFFRDVGLPIHLGQLGLDAERSAEIEAVVASAMQFPFLSNMPFEVTGEGLCRAVLAADALGLRIARESGDTAWRSLRRA